MTTRVSEENNDDTRQNLYEELVRCLTILDKLREEHKQERKKMKDEKNGVENEITRLCRILNGEQESPLLPFDAQKKDPDDKEDPKVEDDEDLDVEVEDEDEEEEEQEPAGTHIPTDSWRMDR
jgi:hypothetical protein